MPNWCFNCAEFKFPNNELYNKFIEAIKTKNLFSTFAELPCGKDENGEYNWDFQFAIECWGTKWEPEEIYYNEGVETLTISASFDTAWAPPLQFYEKLNKTYGICVVAQFYESGVEMFGSWDCTGGAQYYDYPLNKEELDEMKKILPSDLNTFMESEWENLEELWINI